MLISKEVNSAFAKRGGTDGIVNTSFLGRCTGREPPSLSSFEILLAPSTSRTPTWNVAAEPSLSRVISNPCTVLGRFPRMLYQYFSLKSVPGASGYVKDNVATRIPGETLCLNSNMPRTPAGRRSWLSLSCHGLASGGGRCFGLAVSSLSSGLRVSGGQRGRKGLVGNEAKNSLDRVRSQVTMHIPKSNFYEGWGNY